ncbi:MAG TPA: SIMPL domain-containing protein [Acidimicrobiales bacterium]
MKSTWMVAAALGGGAVLGVTALGVINGTRAPVAPATAQATPEVQPSPRQITVGGIGTVSGIPDTLTINLGVHTRADKAVDALRDASNRTTALIGVLKGAGVAAVDITTSDVSLYPRYASSGDVITGYEAGNSVTAKLRDLGKAGLLIDAAAEQVGDAIRLGGISFAIDDTGPLYVKARELAVGQARAQAEQLAKAAGVQLGRVLSMSETPRESSPVYRYAEAASDAAGAKVPIEQGSQELQLSVSVVYEISG